MGQKSKKRQKSAKNQSEKIIPAKQKLPGKAKGKLTNRQSKDIWKGIRKDFDVFLKNVSVLFGRSRQYVKKISNKSEIELEIMALKLKRENLYRQLGKEVASSSRKTGHLKRKLVILNRIKNIDKILKNYLKEKKV